MRNQKKGFTLIELLVVISIISLFSSIVLAGLQDAKRKANDAKIKEQLLQIRPAAALYHDIVGSYGWPTGGDGEQNNGDGSVVDCDNLDSILESVFDDSLIRNSILALSNYPNTVQHLRCASNLSAFVVAAPLYSPPGGTEYWWCVDSENRALVKIGGPHGVPPFEPSCAYEEL